LTKLRVVIHASTGEALVRARSNARNLIAARPDCECEIVVNAGAVQAALDDTDRETDPYLRVCGNTLKAKGLKLPPAIKIVEATIVYLAVRQAEGWSYISA